MDQHGNSQGHEIQNSIEDEDGDRWEISDTSKFDSIVSSKVREADFYCR